MRANLVGLWPVFLAMSKTPVTFVSLTPVAVALAASHAVGSIGGVRASAASYVGLGVPAVYASIVGY